MRIIVKRQDLEALSSMVAQAQMIVSNDPIPAGEIKRVALMLETVERVLEYLLQQT